MFTNRIKCLYKVHSWFAHCLHKLTVEKPLVAIVVQVMSDIDPEVLQRAMFCQCDVICVCFSRLGGPNFFAQSCKPILVAMVVTSMQAMPVTWSHPVRSLCPQAPPDIALEGISQTALGNPVS